MTTPTEQTTPPVVAIVGRPNVGKSALLNCLARQRIAIVDPMSGVTRDRVTALIEHDGRLFELWDTGGIGSTDDLSAEVEAQIDVALRRADLILLVVDAQAGLQPMDTHVAQRLRRLHDRLILVANKVDCSRHEEELGDFFKLGLGNPLPVSALHRVGRTELLDRILRATPKVAEKPSAPELRLAVVGRQNVGKSTLINTLAQEDRVIVSEIPGTTRDSVDVRFELDGHAFIAIDTAGVKRRTRIKDSVEFYSFTRTDSAIRRADVVLLMLDVTADVTRMDMRIGRRIEDLGKPCAIVVNKWDLSTGFTPEEYTHYLNAHLHMLSYAPVSFLCAKDGMHVRETIELARTLHEQSLTEVSTSRLNELLAEAQEHRRPEPRKNLAPKILYGTQISVSPPTILLFCSHPHLISQQYTRYLTNFLRQRLECEEVPIRIFYRSRHAADKEGKSESGDATKPRGRPQKGMKRRNG